MALLHIFVADENGEMALRFFFVKSAFGFQSRFPIAQYFTSVNIVMNNKSVAVNETLANNPFYLKYASKISSLQQYKPLLSMHFAIAMAQF